MKPITPKQNNSTPHLLSVKDSRFNKMRNSQSLVSVNRLPESTSQKEIKAVSVQKGNEKEKNHGA